MRAKKHAQRTRRQRGDFTPRLYQTFSTPGGVVRVAVNRRGCPPTPLSADFREALAQVVNALHGQPPTSEPAADGR